MNDKIKEILSKYKTIAMVGVSKDDKKPSTIVMKYMQKYGFKVIPVNPSAKGQKILGEEVFKNLKILKLPLISWMCLDHLQKLISTQKRV